LGLVLPAALAFGQVAAAEDFNLIAQKGQASLGSFLNNSTLKIRLDGEDSRGTNVNWGDTFGNHEASRFRLDAVYRFSGRHHLRLMYTDYSLSVTRTLDEDIDWGDDVLLAGSSVRARHSFAVIEAAYEYAFRHTDNMELAGTVGLHYTQFTASLEGNLDSSGGGIGGEVGGKAAVDAPLPVVGLRGMWRLGHDFYLDAQLQYFALAIDQYDGSLVNYRAALFWQPKKSVGVGVGYDSFNVNVDVTKDRFTGSMDWTYQGPQIFYNIGF